VIIFATVLADLEHCVHMGFSVFNSLVITILKDEFLSVNNGKQFVCLQTSNMSSGYKLQHKNNLETELFSKCSLHMIMLVML
jgi:hypothetical protein